MVSRFSFVVAAGVAALLYVTSAHADGHSSSAGIKVILNHAKVLKLSRAASTIVIGNPEIADATVQDTTTVILTGRGFGQTNMVILDDDGTPILDEVIAVGRDASSTMRVYRRSEIENLSCEPECEGAYLTEAELQALAATRAANSGGGGAGGGD